MSFKLHDGYDQNHREVRVVDSLSLYIYISISIYLYISCNILFQLKLYHKASVLHLL